MINIENKFNLRDFEDLIIYITWSSQSKVLLYIFVITLMLTYTDHDIEKTVSHCPAVVYFCACKTNNWAYIQILCCFSSLLLICCDTSSGG